MAMYTGHMSKLQERYKDLQVTQDLIRHTTHKEIHNRWHKVQREVLGKVKNENWDLYKSLCDEKVDQLNDQNITEDLRAELRSLFPVQVISISDKRRHPEIAKQFDQVIMLDHKHLEKDDIASLDLDTTEIVLASTYTMHNPELLSVSDMLSHYISDHLTVDEAKLTELESGDRYKAALGLSNNIINLSRPINIYKIGDQVICTSADNYFNDRINKLLRVDTQHVLYHATKNPAHLIETLIHYDKVHFIIENGLINDQTGNAPAWQQRVIQQLRGAGIKVHAVYTTDLYQNMNNVLDHLRSDLELPEVETTIPKSEQQVLTFASA